MNVHYSAMGLAAITLLGCADEAAPESAPPLQSFSAVAGTYSRGWHKTWNETLRIDADGRFDRDSWGHNTGSTHYAGSATVEADRVILHGLPDDAAKAAEIEELDFNRLWIVTWSQRVYLIEDYSMRRFCEDVNAGWEPRGGDLGNALLRNQEWLLPAPGLPDVPAEWSQWLLPTELQGTITQLVGHGACVDLGSNDGLRPGMVLMLRDVPTDQDLIDKGGPSTRNVQVEVVEVEPEQCNVMLGPRSNIPPTWVGLKVTSRLMERP